MHVDGLPCSIAVFPPPRVPNGKVPPGINPFNCKISSLCSLKERDSIFEGEQTEARKILTVGWRSNEPFYQLLVLYFVSLLYVLITLLKTPKKRLFLLHISSSNLPSLVISTKTQRKNEHVSRRFSISYHLPFVDHHFLILHPSRYSVYWPTSP